MNYLFKPLAALTVVTVANAATPDFTGINKASKDFVVMLDALQTDLPKVDDAAGTAKAITSFTQGINAFADAMEDFANKYPDALKGSQPPPEFAAAFDTLQQMGTKYSSVPNGIRSLSERFRTDPKVRSALERLQGSLARLHALGQRTNE